MLACRLHVGLPLACPLACQLACWLASPACGLQPGCFCVVRLHVGLHVRLYVGCCHVVRLHVAPAACAPCVSDSACDSVTVCLGTLAAATDHSIADVMRLLTRTPPTSTGSLTTAIEAFNVR